MERKRLSRVVINTQHRNKTIESHHPLSRSLELDMYGNKDGSIPASYRILYFIGWKPDPSQVSRDATLLTA